MICGTYVEHITPKSIPHMSYVYKVCMMYVCIHYTEVRVWSEEKYERSTKSLDNWNNDNQYLFRYVRSDCIFHLLLRWKQIFYILPPSNRYNVFFSHGLSAFEGFVCVISSMLCDCYWYMGQITNNTGKMGLWLDLSTLTMAHRDTVVSCMAAIKRDISDILTNKRHLNQQFEYDVQQHRQSNIVYPIYNINNIISWHLLELIMPV